MNQDIKKIILDALYVILKPSSFKKVGNSFQRTNGEMKYYINVQSSQTSTSNSFKFTVNTEIFSLFIYRLEETSLSEKDRRHFVKRIGFYLDQPYDKWWVVENIPEAEISSGEIKEIIATKVLPEFEKIKTVSDLRDMWQRNINPGLTEKQRIEYLSLLNKQSIT